MSPRAAFDAELVAALPMIQRSALYLARYDHGKAPDLVQDATLRMLKHWEQFTPGADFGAWAWTVLKNTLTEQSRTASRQAAAATRMPEPITWEPPAQESRDRVRDMLQALETLPASDRAALVETGLESDVPSNARKRLFRARARLHKAMGGES